MKCPQCGYNNPTDRQFCQRQKPDKCLWNLYGSNHGFKRRRGLTEHEALKLSWYRDENKWIENIRNRQIVERNGQKATVVTDGRGNIKGELPMQPKKYWPKPKYLQQ